MKQMRLEQLMKAGNAEIDDVERRSEPEADNQVASNGSEEAIDEADETRTTDEEENAEIDVERRSEADNQVASNDLEEDEERVQEDNEEELKIKKRIIMMKKKMKRSTRRTKRSLKEGCQDQVYKNEQS